MEKNLVPKNEILDMIKYCYTSDSEHMMKVLFDKENGLDRSIVRTASDFILNDNIELYGITDKQAFIGYFGEESFDGDRYLTGFFIMPKSRKEYKNCFWNEVVKHFGGSLKAYMADSNQPAKNFLMKNGCKSIKTFDSKHGIMNLFEFKENE